jgi:hypothetical protein
VTGQSFDVGTDINEAGVRVDGERFETARSDDEKGWLLWSASVPVEKLKNESMRLFREPQTMQTTLK